MPRYLARRTAAAATRPVSNLIAARALAGGTVVAILVGAMWTAAAIAANPAANLDQCANFNGPSSTATNCSSADLPSGANNWVNGNLGASKARYFEGDSIPYRMRLTNLSAAAGNTHTLTIEWDTTKSGKHAIDFLTDWDRTVTGSDPCLLVSPACGPAQADGLANEIPVDGQVSGAGVTPVPGHFRIYGGSITGISAYSYPNGTGFLGDKSARITLTFTATQANPVIAWGGHIATRLDWGALNSAVAIPGSPYHMRLISLDGSGGNQDRSLSAAAVIFPGKITVIKDASPDDGQDFGFAADGGLLPASFTLDDDADGTSSNTQVFSGIGDFKTYHVTETAVSGWTLSLANPPCALSSGNGGSSSGDASTGVVTINMMEGEEYVCTFTNTRQAATLYVIKQVVNDNHTGGDGAQPSDFTMTVTGGSPNPPSFPGSASGTTVDITPNTPYTVTESSVPGYSSDGGSADCVSAAGIPPGGSATCTFINSDSPATPDISTQASATVTVGADIYDTATLSGTRSPVSGVVTFKLYSDSSCSTQIGGTLASVSGSGDGPYQSASYTTTAAGTYYWTAHFAGDDNNVATDTACNEANESVVVSRATPGISTTPNPASGSFGATLNDSATLSGTVNLLGTGSITFTLFSPADPTCSGAGVASQTISSIATNGPHSTTLDYAANAAGTWRWTASFSGDANNEPTTSGCDEEQVTIGRASPTITTTPKLVPNDHIDVSGLVDPGAGGYGDLTIELWDGNACGNGVKVYDTTWIAAGNGPYDTANTTAISADAELHWCVSYSGDANNNAYGPTDVNEIIAIDFNPVPPALIIGAGLPLLAWRLQALRARRRREGLAAQ